MSGHWKAVRDYCPPDWNQEIFRSRYREFGRNHPINYQELLFPGTLPVLMWLKEHGYRIVMATSTPKEKAEEVTRVCGFDVFMEFVLCGDMFHESKPNPEIYLKCLELLNLPKDKCLIVEDSTYGIEAALRAGIPVAARWEKRFSVNQEGADWYINSLEELPELLLGQ